MSIKIKRIESEMTKVISEILLEEARDELLKSITITQAEVASDLSYAKVYFTSLREDKTHKELEAEMAEASSFIRTKVAEKMDLRNTPQLKFLYDETIEYANHIEQIIDEIHKKEE